jgi:PAS domain S-box-containing protein
MKQLSTRLIIGVFFVVAFSFIGFFVVATYKNVSHTKTLNQKTSRSLHLLMLTERVVDNIEELNAAQRGYTFTSSHDYRQPHQLAVKKLGEDIDSLYAFSKAAKERNEEVTYLTSLVQEKIIDSKHSLRIFDSAGVNAIVDKIRSGVSKKINDSLRAALQQMELVNRTVINESNQYLEDSSKETSYRFFILSFVFSVILVSFLLLIYVDFKRKEKIAAQLRYQASLIENLPDAIFTTDRNFIVESWNRYAAELYNISGTEATGKALATLMTIHNSDEEKKVSLAALNKTGFYKAEYLVTKQNNEQIYVLASINTIVNNEGMITGYIAVHRNITERRRLEDSQKEFSKELEKQVKIKTAETTNILERITDGFLALDGNFTFTFVNKKAGEMLGHDPAYMIGKNIFTGFGEISSPVFNEACQTAFKSQQYVFLENYYHPLNRWLENDIYPSADGLSVFFKDITFKKRTETALKESEERYRHLIENIHAGVVVHQPDAAIILYNQEASRLLGIKEDQKIPLAEWYSVSADGERLTQEEYPALHVIRTGEPLINIVAGIDKPGREGRTWVLMNAFPEFDEEKNLKQVVLTFVDITDAKRAEEKLKRSEYELNMAQGIAKTGSWEYNLHTRELKWSKELYRIYELEDTPAGELYEKYRQRFHPEDLPSLDTTLQRAIENKKGYTYQHRIVVGNGAIKHILGIGEIIQNENGDVTGLKGTGQDISEMIKAEEKLQNSYKQIKQLVTHLQDIREQERTSMAREIHDELGQQLTGLKMYISSLYKKIAPQEEDIREKFGSTLELIENTIKSVRKISMDLRPSMLDDLGLMAALEWQSNEFEKRSGIDSDFINETGNTEIPNRLKTGLFRIYQESLTNVARHADAKKIVSSLKLENNSLVLTITDDGKGFSFKNIESKKTLGLFGMKERTLEMGGHYEIKSEPGLGTTVSVTVPLSA